jgi:DNA (cytosine-5)-methyltransferase 1
VTAALQVPATIDLFSGPRGWDVGARAAGLPDALGVEHDADACATSRAAGFPTLQADVAALDLRQLAAATGQLGSPPCPTFSPAGAGTGRDDMPVLVDIAQAIGVGNFDPPAGWGADVKDPRTLLCVEPLRWALALRPTWVAWEQVPPVLPFWEVCAELLTAAGYDVWTGLLRAEQYGVPQTRLRAFLLARRDGEPVRPPAPTHRRYLPPKKHDGGGLFDVADLTERRVHPEDRDLLPWVSMAEALGWAEGPYPCPAPTVTGGGTEGGGGVEVFAGPDQRERARLAAVPPTAYDRRQGTTAADGTRTMVPLRPVTEPAPTIAADGLVKMRDRWVFDRPATTVLTDARVHPPGHKVNADDIAAGRDGYDGRAGKNAVRVTVGQAAALQSFPGGHPFAGPRSSRYRQVGNAVPPLLARRVIEAVAGPEIHAARERRAA